QQIFGQFKVLFIHLIATRGGDGKGDEELEHVILGRGLAPTKEKLVQSVAKERKHGQDRAALDDDVEQIRLARQPLLGNEQMASGGNREKLGYSFNDSEQDDGKPIRHGGRDEKRPQKTSENGGFHPGNPRGIFQGGPGLCDRSSRGKLIRASDDSEDERFKAAG